MPALRLEVFEELRVAAGEHAVALSPNQIEELRLDSYETGYDAGWEDALRTVATDESRQAGEVANSLLHLSFTHHEARAHFWSAVKPLIIELTTRLLPELAREALAPVVLDTLMPLIDDATDQPIRLRLHPTSRAAVERLLTEAAGLPLVIAEDEALSPGQVYLDLGRTEHRVDMAEALSAIQRTVIDFFAISDQKDSHGTEP